MTSQNDPKFAQFLRRRERLNARLDATRAQFDTWLVEHTSGAGPSIVALATLEALLKTRRDALAELVALDDEFMEHLIELRTGVRPD
ncbi:MAG TPA: hypothetical protein VI876_11150 [Dehalococcoidia bacterium]|jgi:hypothetical protein|nr:hypothetical protein [Dehalococcoidia bacterium]